MMFDSVIPVFSEQINPEAVGLRIDNFQESFAHLHELPRIYEAFEDGILHPLAVIETRLRSLPQPAAPGRRDRGDIVCDQDLHTATANRGALSFPDKGGIGVEIAAEVARQEAGLEMRHDAPRHFLEKKWVDNFLALSLLPGDENFLA